MEITLKPETRHDYMLLVFANFGMANAIFQQIEDSCRRIVDMLNNKIDLSKNIGDRRNLGQLKKRIYDELNPDQYFKNVFDDIVGRRNLYSHDYFRVNKPILKSKDELIKMYYEFSIFRKDVDLISHILLTVIQEFSVINIRQLSDSKRDVTGLAQHFNPEGILSRHELNSSTD